KDLARVERAFRTLKSVDLQIRPVHHWIEPRVRAHVFLCMIAYYVEWHLREAWAPILRPRAVLPDKRLPPPAGRRSAPRREWRPSDGRRRRDRRACDGSDPVPPAAP